MSRWTRLFVRSIRPAHDYRLALGLSTATMLALSWPLWVEPSEIPRVPFLAGLPQGSWLSSRLLFVALLSGIVVGSFGARNRRRWQLGSFGILTVLVLQDQHRFQPWVYLYLAATLLDVGLDTKSFVATTRLWYIGLYVHSGLSKLDASFRDELGTILLNQALAPFGLDCRSWSNDVRTAVVLAFPLSEIVVGLLLAFPFSRWFGVVAARFFHGSLILFLGPLGLDHSLILLVWNLAMLIEVGPLFRSNALVDEAEAPSHAGSTLSTLIRWFVAVALITPLAERSGWFDVWPSHALYASHVERLAVYLHEDELASYSSSVRRHLQNQDEASGPWRKLDLTGWSRSVRGTPVYPQNRANLGLAEALASWGGRSRLVKVVEWSAADRWTNARVRAEYVGAEMIRLRRRRFYLNAAPFVLED